MSQSLVSDLLAGARPPEHCIAIADGERITLARFRADILHNADMLGARFVKRGVVACDSGYWFLVGALALLSIGAEVILPPNSQPGTLQSLAPEVDSLLIDCETIGAWKEYQLRPSRSAVDPFHADLNRTRLYFFTSGSTGEMKRVEKSLAMFEREAVLLEQHWGAAIGEVPVIGTVTHQHVFGMTFRIMWPLIAGRPFHSEFHVDWESLQNRLDGPSIIVSSPAQLTRLGGLDAQSGNNRPRLIISAGAPLPMAAACETTAIFGCAPTEVFGSTEAGVIAWRDPVSEHRLWNPFPTVEIATNNEGVLMLRSPHSSYTGWHRQADRIALCNDGRFRLDGRIDRVVKIEGKRVSLQRLERCLAALPWVDEAAVITLDGRHKHLGAVVQLSEWGLAELKRLGKFRFARELRRELSVTEDPAALPRRWRFVADMPVDGLGKRRLGDIAALLEQTV